MATNKQVALAYYDVGGKKIDVGSTPVERASEVAKIINMVSRSNGSARRVRNGDVEALIRRGVSYIVTIDGKVASHISADYESAHAMRLSSDLVVHPNYAGENWMMSELANLVRVHNLLRGAKVVPPAFMVIGDSKYITRQVRPEDKEAMRVLLADEAKRDRNLFEVSDELLSKWVNGHAAVTETVESDGKKRIVASMSATLHDNGLMWELRAAVVHPDFRSLEGYNVNEANRKMLLQTIFAKTPNALVVSVRNGAPGPDALEKYYDSMRPMGFKKIYEFRGEGTIEFPERYAAALSSIPLPSGDVELIKNVVAARLSKAQSDEVARVTNTMAETDEKKRRFATKHAIMTVVTRPWFDGSDVFKLKRGESA